MTHLYNCRHDGDQYRITKFDADLNVEASYLTTLSHCDCPAGERDTCRHRQMLHRFLARNAIGTDWFFDHDRGGWVQMALPGAEPGGHREQASVPPLPQGVTMVSLDDPRTLHNAIADAVGEPRIDRRGR